MEDLQREVLIKSSGVDRLQAELAAAHKESECVRRRLRHLEEDLTKFKQQNRELQDEVQRRAEEAEAESSTSSSSDDGDAERVAELEEQVTQLQAQLNEVRSERDKLEKEREEEMKIVQLALEEALVEKALIQARFEKDFEKLRTVNTDREQQLLDDFEWKLREVEQACKRRLEERDKVAKQLEMKLKLAEQQLQELPQLKAFEAEVVQLRGLTHEQGKSLRMSSRQQEQLQVSERILKDDVARLRTLLEKEKSHAICMQSLHEKKMADNEKLFQSRLDQQKSDVASQWEDRLRRECSRLKAELDQLHSEEKHLAVETAKVQKEQEMQVAKQGWERRMQECLNEISTLKDRLTEKDTYYHAELEKAQTNADRDIFDLRRKLDKIDLSYQEQMEKLTEKHEKEMEQLNWESERKVQQLEQNWQLQMSSTRATLELVKEQMERDAQDRLDAAEQQHHKQLDAQWDRLVHEKEVSVAELEKRHQVQLEHVRNELERASKKHSVQENEQLLEIIANLKKQLQGQTAVISDLQGNVDLLQGGMQVLNQEISNHSVEMQRVQNQAATRLRELETEQRKKLTQLKDRFAAEAKQWQQQTKTLKDKLSQLSRRLQEAERRGKGKAPRHDDSQVIASLKQEIHRLTEEKRLCQLQHHRKKGLDPAPPRQSICRAMSLESVLNAIKAQTDAPRPIHTTSEPHPACNASSGNPKPHPDLNVAHYTSGNSKPHPDPNIVCSSSGNTESHPDSKTVCTTSDSSEPQPDPDPNTVCSSSGNTEHHPDPNTVCTASDNSEPHLQPDSAPAQTFDAIDIPSSKMQILLTKRKSRVGDHRLEVRSKSLEAPTTQTAPLTMSESAPQL